MRRFILSATTILALGTALTPSASVSETVMSRQDVEELASSSSAPGPILVWALTGILLVALLAGGSSNVVGGCTYPTGC